MARRLFALDQNFPEPIVTVLADFMAEAELVPVGDIDPRLTEVDDWEILLSLLHHQREWDGLITTDTSMLSLPREIAVLCQTKLTLVATKAAGHDPLRATGLLFAYLPGICKQTTPDRAQLWVLHAAQLPASDPWQRIQLIAKRQKVSADDLYRASKLSEKELGRDPLA